METLRSPTQSTKHSRSNSSVADEFNSATLSEMFHGPTDRHSKIIMIDGKMMSEEDATRYTNDSNLNEEMRESQLHVKSTFVSDDISDNVEQRSHSTNVCHVEINLQAPSLHEFEDCFGEKVENDPKELY